MAYSTISKPSLNFNTKLYSGDGTNGRAITGVGFQPDWCWFKSRTNTYEHQVYDVVRGVTKRLIPNDTSAEGTQANGLSAFGADGFTVGDANGTNVNGQNYVSWNWKAANSAGVTNNNGTIQSTVSANAAAGFSIIKWTGSGSAGTVGHGLSAAPVLTIRKVYSGTGDWYVHTTLIDGSLDFLKINTTDAKADSSLTGFTSTTIGVGGDTSSTVLYAFTSIKGYSKFGSYTGNGNANGVFVYTGFKPALVIRKRTDTTADWRIDDNKRPDYNVIPHTLFPNGNNSETSSTHYETDFLSNGFKCYGTSGNQNASGGTYIYMAFAEEPLVANVGASIPATAR